LIEFESGSEEEHMRNFNKISKDLKTFEEEYKECINAIHDQVFTEEEIEECVGPDFKKVILDIKYETLKIISRGDAKVKENFLEHCYKPAGTNEQFATSCDIMEKDVLDMLWNAMNFVEICRLNEDKYLSVISAMPRHNFEELMNNLDEFSAEFFELLDEIDSHKEVTVLRLKTLVDDRTKLIIEKAQESAENPEPKIIKHHITIETTVHSNEVNTDNLPGSQFENDTFDDADVMHELNHEEEENLKTRKLRLNKEKIKALQAIRQKNRNIDLQKKKTGKYTRLFRNVHNKYDGLNRINSDRLHTKYSK
jgi:hypothetical protein